MFADHAPDFALIPHLAASGFQGVMLERAQRASGHLRVHLDDTALAQFVSKAQRTNLLAGLAGSLRATDIPPLLKHAPDVLGFRGAACGGLRHQALEASALSALRKSIPDTKCKFRAC
jgi:dihydroneopterin aldolase